MELKKFKQLRSIGESVFTQTAGDTQIEVRKIVDDYILYIGGINAEAFKTKDAALAAADEAVEFLGNEQ